MRETPKQKENRLIRVTKEQKQEISELKKQRRSMQYQINRLEKSALIIQEKNIEIDNLKNSIEELKISLSSKEELFESMEHHYKKEISKIASQNNSLLNSQKLQRKKIIDEYSEKFDEELNKVLYFLQNDSNYESILRQYQEGEFYFNIKVGGEEKTYPIFSTKDLFIQVHPDTGHPLTKFHKKILEKWSYLNLDYLKFYSPYQEWLDKNRLKVDDATIIKQSYHLGKALLPFYEKLLFK